jgi:hypothetical protein
MFFRFLIIPPYPVAGGGSYPMTMMNVPTLRNSKSNVHVYMRQTRNLITKRGIPRLHLLSYDLNQLQANKLNILVIIASKT